MLAPRDASVSTPGSRQADLVEPVDVGRLDGLAPVDRVLSERGAVTGFSGDPDVAIRVDRSPTASIVRCTPNNPR
jgi:hypothetical protein